MVVELTTAVATASPRVHSFLLLQGVGDRGRGRAKRRSGGKEGDLKKLKSGVKLHL